MHAGIDTKTEQTHLYFTDCNEPIFNFSGGGEGTWVRSDLSTPYLVPGAGRNAHSGTTHRFFLVCFAQWQIINTPIAVWTHH